MNVRKPVKILIGVLTIFDVLFPFVIMPVFIMFFMFSSGFPFLDQRAVPNPNDIERTMFPMMLVFYPIMICFSLVQLGLKVFYLVHEIKNKVLTDTYRILFVLGTFFLSYVALPIYFFAYLWKDNPQDVVSPEA